MRISRQKFLIQLRSLLVTVQQLQSQGLSAESGLTERLTFQAPFEGV